MLTEEEKQGLGVALNEARLLGAEVDAARRLAAITLSVLTLPPEGPPPSDPRLQLLLRGVTRVAASLRLGNWNDAAAPVQAFELPALLEVVQSFGGQPIFGWEFFDIADKKRIGWHDKTSLDVRLGDATGEEHSISLFQDGEDDVRHLDLCLWFQSLEFRTALRETVPLDEVIAGGRRWWDALFRSDPRTAGSIVIPLRFNEASVDEPSDG